MDDHDFDLYEIIDNINNQNNLLILQYFRATVERRKRKYVVRKRLDPFLDFDDQEFERRFRFSKNQVENLFNLINGRETLDPLVEMQRKIYTFYIRIKFICLRLIFLG